MTHQKWLLHELDHWHRDGIIDGAVQEALQKRYAADPSAVSWRQIILCSLGALLIGLGVIALLAANWDFLSREMRAFIALLPLTLCVGAYLLGLKKGWKSQGFFEPLGIFWGLAVGTGLALIAQTYQISGDEIAFTMAWTLMLLPVMYATRSVSAALGYFIGLFVWACLVYDVSSSTRMMFWPLACLAVPLIVSLRKESPNGIRAGIVTWGAALCATAALGLTLEKTLPGLWMIIYSGMFASLLLGGIICEPRNISIWQTPMRTLGGCGLAVLLYLLTFRWPWKEIGWHYYRSAQSVSYVDSALALLAPVLSVILLVFAHRRREHGFPAHTLWGLAPIAVAIAYCITSSGTYLAGISAIVITLFLGVLGLAVLAKGIIDRQVIFVNCGVLIVLGLILGKFFTSDVGFTVKGIAFIICGCLFFAVNMLAGRQLKKAGGAQ